MPSKSSGPHVSAANSRVRLTSAESISDDDLIRGFTLSLGAYDEAKCRLDAAGVSAEPA